MEKEKGLIKSVKIKRVRVKSMVASNSDYKLNNPSRKQFSTQALHFLAYQSLKTNNNVVVDTATYQSIWQNKSHCSANYLFK